MSIGAAELVMRVDIKAMQMHMAKFIDEELAKRAIELKASVEMVVKELDFEKEFREQFEYAAREKIRDWIRVRCAQKAMELMDLYKVDLSVVEKARPS